MEFRFTSRRPAGLERYVESIWHARGRIDYPSERIAPTGSTVAVIVLGDPIRETPADGTGEPLVTATGFLIGPHDRPVVNEPLGETHCAGVVTTPVGCAALFGIRPATVRGRVVDLGTAWPAAGPLRRRLLDLAAATVSGNDAGTTTAMATDPRHDSTAAATPRHRTPTATDPATDPGYDAATATAPRHDAATPGSDAAAAAAMLDAVTATLTAGLRETDVERCERAVAALEAAPARGIGALAAELGVSHGHLDHEFTEIVGLSPRTLARILRLRALLDRLDVYGPVPWSALAAEFGWFDQSHFIRDFKRHTGVTPSEYVAAQRGSFTPDQAAPGFVPQR